MLLVYVSAGCLFWARVLRVTLFSSQMTDFSLGYQGWIRENSNFHQC